MREDTIGFPPYLIFETQTYEEVKLLTYLVMKHTYTYVFGEKMQL